MRTVTIVAMSDTHNHHERVPLPAGDVLVHCGDSTLRGSRDELLTFLYWFARTPFEHRVLVGGNHDWALETGEVPVPPGVTYLSGEAAQVAGLRFFGAAWRPRPSWVKCDDQGNVKQGRYSAFGVMLDEAEARWARIPLGTDVVVTHVPPDGVLDLGPVDPDGVQRRRGCPALLARLRQVRPQLHLFGHNHHETGLQTIEGTTHVNAALLDDDYQLVRPPIVLEVEAR
jgi:Icc-related predicted phosphoesterase